MPHSSDDYSNRLIRLQTARWKRWLNVQAPYRWHIRRIAQGKTLEIGCGIGRNLSHLEGNAIGIDNDPACVAEARRLGLNAFQPNAFAEHAKQHPNLLFDNLLFSHVLEHMPSNEAVDLIAEYKKSLKPNGRIIIITPQEVGYSSDKTHVNFLDFSGIQSIAKKTEFTIEKQYSFPFPRWAGKIFLYNEFISILKKQ